MRYLIKTAVNPLKFASINDAFDYVLLCNKVCGAAHFNMQMKVVVEEEEDFNNWLKEQKTLAQVVNN